MRTKSLTRMSIKNLRSFAPVREIGICLLLFASGLQAQTTLSGDHIITGDLNVGTSGTTGNVVVTGETGGSAAPSLVVTGEGGVVFSGSFGVGQIPTEADGTRFMWYPGKAALRAGRSYLGCWDDATVGNYSVAFGIDSVASGLGSIAFGQETLASGVGSVAMGLFTDAIGFGSLAVGDDTVALGDASVAMGVSSSASGFISAVIGLGSGAWGDFSIAMGEGAWALGNHSLAMGDSAWSDGDHSVAIGSSAAAEGDASVAIGYSTLASGASSFALGKLTYALGVCSAAMGESTSAISRSSLAIGRYNIGGGDPEDWQGEDPLFEIGNGTSIEPSNALTVFKNGNVVIPKRQGDILMGEFGNPE